MKRYYEEKSNIIVEENDHGFLAYEMIKPDTLMVIDFYIVPDKRYSGEGKKLEDIVINREKPKYFYAEVQLDWKKPEESILSVLHRGFSIVDVNEKRILFGKEV